MTEAELIEEIHKAWHDWIAAFKRLRHFERRLEELHRPPPPPKVRRRGNVIYIPRARR